MPSPDTAKAIKNALATAWESEHPAWTVTLHVDDEFVPTAGKPALLVADDGGPAILSGPWPWAQQHGGYAAPFRKRATRRPTLRLTAFAKGRDEARGVVDAAVDWLLDNRTSVGIARITDVSDQLVTRDRTTGAYLASVTMPAIVRPV